MDVSAPSYQLARPGSGRLLVAAFALTLVSLVWQSARAQEVVVRAGIDDIITWLDEENWWGDTLHADHLEVPRIVLTGINPSWREASQELTVEDKKEVFYRFILPLVLLANELVLDRRTSLLAAHDIVTAGGTVSDEALSLIRDGAVLLRAADRETAATIPASGDALLAILDELLYKLDTIPAGLALGQAAYESGYGTSRFTVEGNALFGQWTYGGQGLVPEQQRQDLGDHRIAAFDWPFDSVRGYFINLMSHPAYEEFRQLRADMRAAGRPLDSLTLADGLRSYSERGQEYVDTLKGIIRVNDLAVADDAAFRDGPMIFAIGAANEAEAEEIRAEIERMRETGELERTIQRMRLE